MSEEIVRRARQPIALAAEARTGALAEAGVVSEVLAFVLADECYALPLSSIREILKMPALTEVPRAPADVIGIISVRGRVTTVVDLRRRLRMPESPPTKATRVLLVDDGCEVLGLLVDRVLSVYRLRADEVEVASTMAGDTADYVLGIGRPRAAKGKSHAEQRADEMLILLDPVPLLRR